MYEQFLVQKLISLFVFMEKASNIHFSISNSLKQRCIKWICNYLESTAKGRQEVQLWALRSQLPVIFDKEVNLVIRQFSYCGCRCFKAENALKFIRNLLDILGTD